MDAVTNPMPTENHTLGPASLRVRQPPSVPAHMRERIREIGNLYVEPGERNKGYATRLLRKVCQKADAANMVLMLFAEPFEDDSGAVELTLNGLTTEQLVEFYNRFGFAITQMQPQIMMARMPHAEERMARLAPITQAILQEYK